MKRSAPILLGLFTTTLALLAACGGAAPEPTASPASTPSISEQKSKRARPHISTVGDELRFDRAKLKETALFKVRVTFTNGSTVNQHNWVLVKKGTKDEVAAAAVIAGAANSWIPPQDDRIIAHSGLLDPGETEEISFTAPLLGTYQFLCTFPGHSATMFGDFVFVSYEGHITNSGDTLALRNMPHELVEKSLRLFGEHVMLVFN